MINLKQPKRNPAQPHSVVNLGWARKLELSSWMGAVPEKNERDTGQRANFFRKKTNRCVTAAVVISCILPGSLLLCCCFLDFF